MDATGRRHVGILLATAAIILWSPPLSAQDDVHVGFGLAGGLIGDAESGPGLYATLSLANPSRAWSVRAAYLEEFTLFVDPSESAWDVGLLYGRRLEGESSYASVSAGGAIVGGMRRGEYIASSCTSWCLSSEYERDPFVTFGVPVAIELAWTPFRRLGAAVVGFGNVNPVRPFAGAALVVLFGSLRE